MEVYFLRHGETEWNRERRIQGSTEWTDLTDEGVRLAEATRDGMIAAGLSFDRLYSSPYRRALHTAQIIGAGLGLEPVVDCRLREISFGPYEGTRYGEGLFSDDNIRACFMDAVAARVREFMDEVLVPLSGTASRVLVVAHGGVLRTVLRLVAGLPLSGFWEGPQPNCCAHVVEMDGHRMSLKARSVVVLGA